MEKNIARIRVLEVYFYSDDNNRGISFGTNWRKDKSKIGDEVSISITGTKYLSPMKDNFTITISNLTYNEILYLIEAKMYRVVIKAGYRNGNIVDIFNGYVIYVSNYQEDRTTNKVVILCGNKVVAEYGQKKLNLSINSGINMYSALKFVLRRGGITNPHIDPTFKNRILQDMVSVENQQVGQRVESFCNTYNFASDGDSLNGGDLSIMSPSKTTKRLIKLTSDRCILVNGYPKLTSEGIMMTILPTFDISTLNTIQIDNSILNMSVSSYSSAADLNITHFLDPEGYYIVYQLSYNLSNRERMFNITLNAKSKNLFGKIGELINE